VRGKGERDYHRDYYVVSGLLRSGQLRSGLLRTGKLRSAPIDLFFIFPDLIVKTGEKNFAENSKVTKKQFFARLGIAKIYQQTTSWFFHSLSLSLSHTHIAHSSSQPHAQIPLSFSISYTQAFFLGHNLFHFGGHLHTSLSRSCIYTHILKLSHTRNLFSLSSTINLFQSYDISQAFFLSFLLSFSLTIFCFLALFSIFSLLFFLFPLLSFLTVFFFLRFSLSFLPLALFRPSLHLSTLSLFSLSIFCHLIFSSISYFLILSFSPFLPFSRKKNFSLSLFLIKPHSRTQKTSRNLSLSHKTSLTFS